MRIDWKPAVKNLVAYGILAGALVATFFFTSPSISYSLGASPAGVAETKEASTFPTASIGLTTIPSEFITPTTSPSADINTMPISTEPSQSVEPHIAYIVNINTATATELDTLPGIGPVKAAAIVTCRDENGPYKTVNDLLMVKGIGEKTLEKLLPLICCE